MVINQARDEMELDANGEDSQDQLVKKLVRYALACEYSRQHIKRDGIREKVFGKHRAPFKQVFDEAQMQLRNKFGMEMVELPSKEKITLKERRAAQKSSQTPASSRAYILTSALPAQYRIPAIIPPSAVPSTAVEASYIGLYTMIISLISLCGGTLTAANLERYLNRMNADVNMPMDKTENVVQKMVKQGYLVKIKEKTGDENMEWMVGPRGKVEVGDQGVQGLVTQVYGETAPEDLARRVGKSLGITVTESQAVEVEEPANESRNGEPSIRRTSGRTRKNGDG